MPIDDVRRVLVVGAGTVGPQVAVQCALNGLSVVLHDVRAPRLAAAIEEQRAGLAEFVARGTLDAQAAEEAIARIETTTDLAAAAREVDLVSESVTENVQLKRQVLHEVSSACPAHAVITTNSSYFLPSMLARSLARPEQFAALHFHVPVWLANVVDIMPHPGTSLAVVELLRRFAGRIGQIPIVARRENHGYVFNSMLRQLLMSAMTLSQTGVASEEDVDRAWMGVTKMPIGPFGLIDNIGLETVYDIVSFWGGVLKDPQAQENAAYLKKRIDAGKLGIKSGRGFYCYPNPAYAQSDFLTQAGAAPQAQTAPRPPETRPGVGPPLIASPVAERFVLRAIDAPAVGSATVRLTGAVLILGQCAEADALTDLLGGLGADIIRIPALASMEETLAWLHRALAEQPAAHLFLLSACEPEAAGSLDAARWLPRYERGLLLPYFVCQKWIAAAVAAQIEAPSLIVATSLGGDLAAAAPPVAPEGGGLAGLAKAVFMESMAQGLGSLAVKVVDLSPGLAPRAAADVLMAELADAQSDAAPGPFDPQKAISRFARLEVGGLGGTRHFVRVAPAPLPLVAPERLPADGAWVVTGGARGITALVARALGTRFGLKLHLVGTTPLPETDYTQLGPQELAALRGDVMKRAYAAGEKPNIAWTRVEKGIEVARSLAGMRAAGINAAYHACDLGQRDAVERMLAEVRARSGPIRGIVHGAGVEVTGRFTHKQLDVVAATLRPKDIGTLALMELTAADPLEYFIAFGSAAGRFGGVGQTEYAMANDLLAKLVAWFRAARPECHSVVFHWPGWDQVGMAARPASRFSLSTIHHTFLPPAEGIAHLLAEMAAGMPAAEVVIVARQELPEALVCAG